MPGPRVSDPTLTAIWSSPVPGTRGPRPATTTNAHVSGTTTYASTARGCTGWGWTPCPRTPPRAALPVCLSVCRLPPPLLALSAGASLPPSRCVWIHTADARLPVCYETRHVSVRLWPVWRPLSELPAGALPAFLAFCQLFCDCLASTLYIFCGPKASSVLYATNTFYFPSLCLVFFGIWGCFLPFIQSVLPKTFGGLVPSGRAQVLPSRTLPSGGVYQTGLRPGAAGRVTCRGGP